MKKTLLSFFSGLFAITLASAQCTPDPALANEGFGLWPDTIPYIQACTGCGPATRVVDLVTFTDTLITVTGVGDVTIYIDAFKITDVTGAPASVTYGTDVESGATAEAPWGEWLNGGTVPNQTSTQGCVYITGDEAQWVSAIGGGPNSDGIYPLNISVDARIGGTNPDVSFLIANGTWLSNVPANLGGGSIVIDEYFLDVRQGNVGINDIDPSKLGIVDNYPNPFSGTTTIQFSAPSAKNLTFVVYSILGNEVYSEQISAKQGLNNFDFDASALNSGMYIYSLTDGTSVATKKMTVK